MATCHSPPLARLPPPDVAAWHAAAVRCLANRTIWMLGDSVSRHWAFAFVEILARPHAAFSNSTHAHASSSAAGKARQAEMRTCGAARDPKTHGGCAAACACTLRVGRDIAVSFGFNWQYASTALEAALVEGDPPTGRPPPDLVVLAGPPMCAMPARQGAPPRACPLSGVDRPSDAAPRAQLPVAEGGAAMAAMARRVLMARAAASPLQFYWRSTTAPCFDDPRNPTSGEVGEAMAAVERSLCAVPGVKKLDGYGWTAGRCAFYDDAVHHARLATAHVATWISDECGLPLAAQADAEHATARPPACTGDCCKRHPGACRVRHEFLSR